MMLTSRPCNHGGKANMQATTPVLRMDAVPFMDDAHLPLSSLPFYWISARKLKDSLQYPSSRSVRAFFGIVLMAPHRS